MGNQKANCASLNAMCATEENSASLAKTGAKAESMEVAPYTTVTSLHCSFPKGLESLLQDYCLHGASVVCAVYQLCMHTHTHTLEVAQSTRACVYSSSYINSRVSTLTLGTC